MNVEEGQSSFDEDDERIIKKPESKFKQYLKKSE